MENKYAYATLLANDDYLIPIQMLNYSLKTVKSKYPLIVMVLDTVSFETIQKLENLNISYKVFPNLCTRLKHQMEENSRNYISASDYFQCIMMQKFYIFDLKDYEKICYFDGDIIVKRNIDFVFNYNAPAAKFLVNDIKNIKQNNFQCAGENMLINTKDFTFKEILNKETLFGFDELVLPHLYDLTEIVNLPLTDGEYYVLHAHAHCCNFKWWNSIKELEENEILNKIKFLYNNLDLLESCKYKIVDLNYDIFKIENKVYYNLNLSDEENEKNKTNIDDEKNDFY